VRSATTKRMCCQGIKQGTAIHRGHNYKGARNLVREIDSVEQGEEAAILEEGNIKVEKSEGIK